MLATFTLALATLATLTTAVPVAQDTAVDVPQTREAFSMYVLAPEIPEIDRQPINGNGLGLWIGKPTVTVCPDTPDVASICAYQNTTVFWSTPIENARGTYIYLSVSTPGGQILYSDGMGHLNYTAAGENSIPSSDIASTYPFNYGPQDDDESTADWGYVSLYGAAFLACSTDVVGEYYVGVVGQAVAYPDNCRYITIGGTRWTGGVGAPAYA
ncbi:hypothetical protein PVAG01_09809 [Phlyctema vagabunda]|uniref:Uncharacterized protein n=1 Tax=Phlyctema vagabunda TaxID=108571 RepID=A0ABR4P465_9HELO